MNAPAATTGHAKPSATWRRVRLGDVCRVVGGSTPKTGVDEFWNGDIVWVTPVDLGRLDADEIRDSERRVSREGHASCGAELVPAGSVVMSSRAPIGHLAIAATELCTNQGCKTFVPGSDIDSLFLLYRLRLAVPELRRLGSGATFAEISKSQCAAFEIDLPPLREQKRIAASLRERLDVAARMRAAADAEAESMRALATATLEDLLQGPLRCGCAAQKCGDIALVTGGIQKSPLRLPQSFHRPFLTVRNVKRGYLDLSDVERMELTPAELKRLMLRAGDLLVVEGNGSRDQIGRNALFRGEIDECIHQNHVIRLRVDEGTLRPEFLSLYLNSRDGMAQLLQRAMTTTGLYTLSVRKIQSLDIPLPDLSQQDGILREWNRLQHELGRGAVVVKSQAVAAQELPVALLRRAFFG